MRKFHLYFYSLCLLLLGCSKEEAKITLPDGSVGFSIGSSSDTIEIALPIISDSLIILELNAALKSATAQADHWVNFSIDTTRMSNYRADFGEGELLPQSSYLLFKSMTKIAAGQTVSEAAELNIFQQTKLKGYTTYVLPVIIESVDGNVEGVADGRTLYYVFKTGKPAFITKTGWAIAGFSSQFNAFAPANLLDENNTTTYWASDIAQQMPQWVTINFNTTIPFSAVRYYLPTALSYPNLGGYPTEIKIETSMNGTDWSDHGVFTGNITGNMQTLETGEVTARFLRFTALGAVKYAGLYESVFISGISLVP